MIYALLAVLLCTIMATSLYIFPRIRNVSQESGLHAGMALLWSAHVPRQVLRAEILVDRYPASHSHPFEEIERAYKTAQRHFLAKSRFITGPEVMKIRPQLERLLDKYGKGLAQLKEASPETRPRVASRLYLMSEDIGEGLSDLQTIEWRRTKKLLGDTYLDVRTTGAIGSGVFVLLIFVGGALALVWKRTLKNADGQMHEVRKISREHTGAKKGLEALVHASAHLTSVLGPDAVIQVILDESGKVLGAERCSVYLLDAERGKVRDIAKKGISAEFSDALRTRWRELPRGQALTRGEPVVIRDAVNDPRQAPIRDLVLREGFRSLAIFPLRLRGTTIGAMTFYFDTPQDFGAEQLSICQAFANHTAVAIENSRLFDRLALEKNRLAAIVDSSNQGILMVDLSGNVVLVNRWLIDLFQLQAAGTIEERAEFLGQCFRDPDEFLRKTLKLFDDPEATADEIFELDLPDGKFVRRFSAPCGTGRARSWDGFSFTETLRRNTRSSE